MNKEDLTKFTAAFNHFSQLWDNPDVYPQIRMTIHDRTGHLLAKDVPLKAFVKHIENETPAGTAYINSVEGQIIRGETTLDQVITTLMNSKPPKL